MESTINEDSSKIQEVHVKAVVEMDVNKIVLPTEIKHTISNTDICIRYGIAAAVILPLGLFIDPMAGGAVAALLGGFCLYDTHIAHWLGQKNWWEQLQINDDVNFESAKTKED